MLWQTLPIRVASMSRGKMFHLLTKDARKLFDRAHRGKDFRQGARCAALLAPAHDLPRGASLCSVKVTSVRAVACASRPPLLPQRSAALVLVVRSGDPSKARPPYIDFS